MSSTNRGAVRRHNDYYPTPIEVTGLLGDWLSRNELGAGGSVLDPSAGEGAILRALEWVGRTLHALEIREECRASLAFCDVAHIGDALLPRGIRGGVGPSPRGDDWTGKYGLVACNPPFSLAREFVETYRYVGKVSAFLLRLNFFASQARAPWWVSDPPAHVLVLPKRPSFTDDGKTDSTDYAWVVWAGRTARGATRLDWLTCGR